MKFHWLAFLFLFFPAAIHADDHYDIILKNGLIVDGSGLPPYKADVAINAGKIAKIGNLGASGADEMVDATGLVVCPGFIEYPPP